MTRRLFVLMVPFAVLVILVGLPGCGRGPDPWADEPGSPRVVVTIAPLESIVRGVAGKNAAVKCLCTETGPHHYTTDMRDIGLIVGIDLHQKIAGLDALEVLHGGGQNLTGDPAAQPRQVSADKGVVGGLDDRVAAPLVPADRRQQPVPAGSQGTSKAIMSQIVFSGQRQRSLIRHTSQRGLRARQV